MARLRYGICRGQGPLLIAASSRGGGRFGGVWGGSRVGSLGCGDLVAHRCLGRKSAPELVHDGLGHVSLLYRWRVAGQVIERLSRPPRKA